MTVSKQNIKAKADIFASKLADYVINHNKNAKNYLDLDYNDTIYKKHRILLTKTETLEILELINQEKKNKSLKVSTVKEKIINTLNTKLSNTQSEKTNTNSGRSDIITSSGKVKTLSEKTASTTNSNKNNIYSKKINQEKQVFQLSETMLQELSTPPRQSIEVKGVSNQNKEVKQDFVKMKALTFISKITNKISTKKDYQLIMDNTGDVSIKEENDYILWNLKIGETTKKDTLEILKKYSKEKTEFYKDNNSISYSDISITVHFDKKNILSKIDFNEYFNGETIEGLKIGDTIEKALKLYGKPISYDKKIIKWKNFNISCLLDKIFSITILDNTLKFRFPKNNTENFVIYTHGFLLGIILQNSTKSVIVDANDRKYVINFMKDYSNIKLFDNNLNYLDYDDIGIKLFFNEKDILNEIEVSSPFNGKTINELKIGDSVEKAINIYGHPQSSDANHLIWGKLKVLVKDYIIKCINIKK